MNNRKRDGKPLLAVKVLVASLPLLLKIALVYLKYKRATKKRKKIFKKTLKKEGVEGRVAEKLVDELPEIRIKDFISNGVGKFNL